MIRKSFLYLPFIILLLLTYHRPELLVTPDPFTGQMYAHNAITTDPVRPYIDWAVSNSFGVLDINFPTHVTTPNHGNSFYDKVSEGELQNQSKDLLCYLWDNYLEGFNSSQIVLMGVGDAYLGVKQLLTFRGTSPPCNLTPTSIDHHRLPIQDTLHPLLRVRLPPARKIRNRPSLIPMVQAALTHIRLARPRLLERRRIRSES